MAKLIAFVSTFCLLFMFMGFVVYLRVYAPPGSTRLRTDVDAGYLVGEVHKLSGLALVRYVSDQGKVVAGVPLSDVTQYDVSGLGPHRVTLHLPDAKIIEITSANDKAAGELRDLAQRRGILDDARKSAETAIRQFLTPIGITSVQFQ